jgi:hypothetical protein
MRFQYRHRDMCVSVYVRCSLHKFTIASMWSARPHGLVVYILLLTALTAPLHLCDCLYVLYLLYLCVVNRSPACSEVVA